MLKEFARSLAKRYGMEILGRSRAYASQSALMGLIAAEQINLVLDVGANTGQFSAELREAGYKGRILSFEPQSAAWEQLRKRSAADAGWTVAERTAVGAEPGTVNINLSENSFSSSILPMHSNHAQAAPESRYVGTESAPLQRLDDLYVAAAGDRVLLKIDVQGFEMPVLQGAQATLATCRAVLAEMSLVPLYEGQVLAGAMWDYLEERGFQPWSIEPGFRDPKTWRMLQMDGLFVRSETL